MPELISFHLDENVNNAIADGLRRRSIDVTTSVKANLISATDNQQLAFAHSQGWVRPLSDKALLCKRSVVLYAVHNFWRDSMKTILGNALIVLKEYQKEVAPLRAQGRVIFTQDRDFLGLHYSGAEHSGIIFVIKGSRTTGKILRGLVLVWEVLTPEDMIGNLEYL